MKKNPISILIGGLLLLLFVLLLFVYQVRTTEVAVVTTFGKPTDEKKEPGAYFRLPWPIHKIYFLDKRIRNFETPLQQSTTTDDYLILLSTYAGWSVDNASDFFPKFDRGSHLAAESKLREMLLNAQKQIAGKFQLQDLINTDPTKLKFAELEREILQLVRTQCQTQKYGIDVKFVGIRRLALPPNNSAAVLERMRSERQRLVRGIEAEGNATASQIRTNALIAAQQLINQANAEALKIRGEGEAEYARVLKVQEQNPDLAKFLYDLAALEAILKDRSTLIMEPSWPLVELLRGNNLPAATSQR